MSTNKIKMLSTSTRLAMVMKQVQECIDKYNKDPKKKLCVRVPKISVNRGPGKSS